VIEVEFNDDGKGALPPGPHPFAVHTVEAGTSAKGNAKLVVRFKHLDSDRELTEHYPLQAYQDKLKNFLVAAGVLSPADTQIRFDERSLQGRKVTLVLAEAGTYTDNDGNVRKSWFNDIVEAKAYTNGAAVEELDDDAPPF
jgi:hypothetical protein